MTLRAIHAVSIEPGRYIEPGSTFEVSAPDADRLIALGAAEAVIEPAQESPAKSKSKKSRCQPS